MMSPEQIADQYCEALTPGDWNSPEQKPWDCTVLEDASFIRQQMIAAIEADRAQRTSDLAFNEVRFTAAFDSEVWESMLEEQRIQWVSIVEDAINEEAHVTATERVKQSWTS